MICNLATTAFGTEHLTLGFESGGVNLAVAPARLVAVNGGPFQNQTLRNGDIITVGSAKLQFWLAAARQRGLRTRELFVWALMAAVTAAQLVLIYWLIRDFSSSASSSSS